MRNHEMVSRIPRNLTLVAAVNNREVLSSNLLSSPCLGNTHSHQILVQEGFASAANAYNDAIDRSENDLIVFLHQDILLPETWFEDLEKALATLEETDPNWGVLGCYGETLDNFGRGYIYTSGRGVLGRPFHHPAVINTLDEIVLILRKSSGLRFDNSLPHFHFYGADICLRAAQKGMKNYAISAFCVHNTHQPLVLPKEFYEAYKHIRRVWRHSLPIQTTCIRITKSNFPMWSRRLREVYLRYVRKKEFGGTRISDPLPLLHQLEGKSQE